MVLLKHFVELYTHRLGIQHYASYLEACPMPYELAGRELSAYRQHLCHLTHTIFKMFSSHRSFRRYFEWLLCEYGYRASAALSEDGWDGASKSQLLALAAELRRLLLVDTVDDKAVVEVLYQSLIKQNRHSVVGKARMFSKTYDAVLIRGATQYGKTKEALLLAWRAWWEGVRIDDEQVGRCVTFLFVRNVGGNDSKRQFACAIGDLNREIEVVVLGKYPLLSTAQVDRFKLSYRDTYDASLDGCQVVAKLCNRWQLDKTHDRELPQLAAASQGQEAEGGDGAQPAQALSLRSYLIFDEDDVNMQGRNKAGQTYKTEEGRCRLLKEIRVQTSREGVDGEQEEEVTVPIGSVMGWASITATPEGLWAAEACENVSFQKLDLLEDADIRSDYYGYDKRVPLARQPAWRHVPSDWEVQEGNAMRHSGAGQRAFLDDLMASGHQRRALVFATLKPRVAVSVTSTGASATALEGTQLNIARRFDDDAQGVITLTYCGGPSNQPENQPRYRCKLVPSRRVRDAVLQWFGDCDPDNVNGAANCDCSRCGACVKQQHAPRIRVDEEEGCVKFSHRDLGASDLVTMMHACAKHLVESGRQQRLPHIVVLTGEMGCRSVSWRSRDGSFYLTDMYVAYAPMRISSNNSVFIKQLLGRICMRATAKGQDGTSQRLTEVHPLRIWCSREVEDNMKKLVENGDAVWENWKAGGVPWSTPMEVLSSLKVHATAGRKRDGLHIASDKVEKRLRITGQPTKRGNYLSFGKALWDQAAQLRAEGLHPYHPAFLSKAQAEDVVGLKAIQRFQTVQLLSKIHYLKLPAGVDQDNEDAVEAWLRNQARSRFDRCSTVQCNRNRYYENFLGYEPSNPGTRQDWWPDLWFQSGPESGMVTVIEHTMAWEEARKPPPQAHTMRLYHRFWAWHSMDRSDGEHVFVDLVSREDLEEAGTQPQDGPRDRQVVQRDASDGGA